MNNPYLRLEPFLPTQLFTFRPRLLSAMAEDKKSNNNSSNSKLKTIVVAGEDYNFGVLVLRVPQDVADSEEGKMLANALLGRDPHYNPYTRMTSKENVDHIAIVDKLLADWEAKYSMKLHSADSDVTLGSLFN